MTVRRDYRNDNRAGVSTEDSSDLLFAKRRSAAPPERPGTGEQAGAGRPGRMPATPLREDRAPANETRSDGTGAVSETAVFLFRASGLRAAEEAGVQGHMSSGRRADVC